MMKLIASLTGSFSFGLFEECREPLVLLLTRSFMHSNIENNKGTGINQLRKIY